MRRLLALVASLFCVVHAVGCATTRNITISTRPPDAAIKVDGADRGKGKVTEEMTWQSDKDVHTVSVSRLGYKEQSIPLKRDFQGDTLNVDLKPLTRRITVTVSPVPANLSIDGQPVGGEPLDTLTRELEFTVDARNNWTTHTVTAERKGFERAARTIAWQDKEPNYAIRLEPQKKSLSITTKPPGAQVFLDGEPLGNSPVTVPNRPFPVDLQTGDVIPQKLRVVKPGYDAIEQNISWDDGKTDYAVDLAAKTKTVRIITDPPGATVQIDGKTIEHSPQAPAQASLQFPPVDEKGSLRTYTAQVTKKTADSEWEPAKVIIGWDQGRTDYPVTLKEIKTRPVALLNAQLQRADDGWEIVPELQQTIAWKDVTEGAQKEPPLQVTRLPRGTQIDTIALSPDGTRMLFTVIFGKDKQSFRSQMIMVRTDGTGGADYMSDGKSLEITPSFTPGGDEIVFSSNRAGKRMSIWSMSATGLPGIKQLTSGDTNDLWPTIDSDPKPRLFYQAMVDTRPDPRLYMTQLNSTTKTDLTQMGGAQPRISPKADAVVFTAVNDKTGKRDIYLMSDKGGVPRNLTNTPDVDEYDPTWNKNGTRIAYVSDAGVDDERRQNNDIWALDLSRPERPVQITVNGSWDDHPQWDPAGTAIYFRSNRGGEWAIWKTASR
jgi:Tol biopolymer transport system component